MASVSLFVLSKGQPAATPPLPHPNGYDDFLAAGNVLVSKVADDSILNKDELQEFVATNSESLLLRFGLTRQCSARTETVIANFGATLSELMNLNPLVKLPRGRGTVDAN